MAYMREVQRGTLFGIGFWFGPGMVLGAIAVIALYLVTHWWILIGFAIAFVLGIVRAIRNPHPRSDHAKYHQTNKFPSICTDCAIGR